ncbi:DUF1870 family protein [Glycomyces tenuis]|uniref:Aca2/YdiL-like domain-containing protein n=1 Tax=Glycomyces tenuis TaxID=58116 RepID=UPI0003FC6055|nr:DUF1870 family protein [Glycomyces tenuis]
MTDYTDPPGMPENERMIGLEFKAVREWLGVSGPWLARCLNVNPRTIRDWEEGRSKIPDRIRLEIERLEEVTAQIVGMNVDALMDAPEPAVATYYSDEDYHADRPGEETTARVHDDGTVVRWPASWHRRVLMRVAQEVPGLVVVEGRRAQ